jgi:hypothetical protein
VAMLPVGLASLALTGCIPPANVVSFFRQRKLNAGPKNHPPGYA